MLKLVLAWLLTTVGADSPEPGPISVAIIAEAAKDDARHHKLGSRHAMDFIERVFADSFPNPIAYRQVWPPVYTDNCPGDSFKDVTSFEKVHKRGYQRGLLLAHKQIWEKFARNNAHIMSNISSYESPKMIIFENDAMEINPLAADVAYQSVVNMTSQFHYLGHCYDRYPGDVPPECCHAYALTPEGARILLHYLDWCAKDLGGSIDQQIKTLGKNGWLNWSAVPASLPYGLSDDYIQKKSLEDGFTIQWGNQAGGLFHQVEFDDISEPIEGAIYKAKWPAKSVFLYKNSTYHSFSNIQTFASMGYDFDQLIVVPQWQIDRSTGDPLPSVI